MEIEKNASNQSGGSFIIDTNGIYSYTSTKVRRVTNITREFDQEGNLVKEVETITEYEDLIPYHYYQPVPLQPQYYTYTTN